MKTRSAMVLTLAAAVTLSAFLVAAPRATLVLRSGDKVAVELVDVNSAGFVVRIGGDTRQIRADEVAAIDFTGSGITAAEAARIQDGRALVVLHGGDTFYGRLFDIGGDSPLRLTFRTPDGDRTVTSSETARIYFARWTGMPVVAAAPAPAAAGAGSGTSAQERPLEQGGAGLSVPANQCWTSTGIIVSRNQFVTFEGTGEIRLSTDQNDVAGVGGSKTGRYARNAPMQGVLAGALIGRVAYGRPFGIGDQRQGLQMPGDGVLFLGINDDECGDNAGEFKVQVSAAQNRRR